MIFRTEKRSLMTLQSSEGDRYISTICHGLSRGKFGIITSQWKIRPWKEVKVAVRESFLEKIKLRGEMLWDSVGGLAFLQKGWEAGKKLPERLLQNKCNMWYGRKVFLGQVLEKLDKYLLNKTKIHLCKCNRHETHQTSISTCSLPLVVKRPVFQNDDKENFCICRM